MVYRIGIDKHREDKTFLIMGVIATFILFIFSFHTNGNQFKINLILIDLIIVWSIIAIIPYVDYWVDKRCTQKKK